MQQPKLDIIGSTEVISFPEVGMYDVPAKIDTGADYSSVWATEVRVEGDQLLFVLLGTGNKHHNGQVVRTSEYRTVKIKNSFGVSEPRYKVRLLCRIGNRSIRGWFTLSARRGMRYPVLLGRKLLKNKFVVDVSKAKVHTVAEAPKRVLLLTSNKTERLQEFAEEVAAKLSAEAEIVVRQYQELVFSFDSGNMSVRDAVDNTDIADYDFVYFKIHRINYPLAVAAAQYLAAHHVPFMDSELLEYVSYDKLSEATKLTLEGFKLPASYCAATDVLLASFDALAERLGLPLVCKEIYADRGRKNYLVNSSQELKEVLAKAGTDDVYLLQQFIPSDGYMRAYVMGSSVPLVIWRSAVARANAKKAHLYNLAGGVNATLLAEHDVPSVVYDLAVRLAKAMRRQVAGVDLIQHKETKEWFALEVNSGPQLVTGSFLDEKKTALAKFIDFELNR